MIPELTYLYMRQVQGQMQALYGYSFRMVQYESGRGETIFYLNVGEWNGRSDWAYRDTGGEIQFVHSCHVTVRIEGRHQPKTIHPQTMAIALRTELKKHNRQLPASPFVQFVGE